MTNLTRGTQVQLLDAELRVVRVRVEGADLAEGRPVVLVGVGIVVIVTGHVRIVVQRRGLRLKVVARPQLINKGHWHHCDVPEADGAVLVACQQQIFAARLLIERRSGRAPDRPFILAERDRLICFWQPAVVFQAVVELAADAVDVVGANDGGGVDRIQIGQLVLWPALAG